MSGLHGFCCCVGKAEIRSSCCFPGIPRSSSAVTTGKISCWSRVLSRRLLVLEAATAGITTTKPLKLPAARLWTTRNSSEMQVMKNGVEVKLQRNALSALQAQTGNEGDARSMEHFVPQQLQRVRRRPQLLEQQPYRTSNRQSHWFGTQDHGPLVQHPAAEDGTSSSDSGCLFTMPQLWQWWPS